MHKQLLLKNVLSERLKYKRSMSVDRLIRLMKSQDPDKKYKELKYQERKHSAPVLA